MSKESVGGLDHLPPHKRQLLRGRIRAIKTYVQARTRDNAEKGAQDLGVGVGHFKKLVSVWEAHQRPDSLPGAEWTKSKRIATSDAQLQVIRDASVEVPDGVTEDVVRAAYRLAEERGLAMPSPVTMRARVKELRAAMEPSSFGSDADLVVDHCAIRIPVAAPGVDATMPVAALVIDVPTRRIVGVALSIHGPDAASAGRALLAATRQASPIPAPDEEGRPPRIAMDTYGDADWTALARAMAATGATLVGSRRERLRRGVAAPFVGEKVNGLHLRPRLADRPPADRRPRMASGQTPMTIAEAQAFVEAVLLAGEPSHAPRPGWQTLATGLAAWLERSG